MCVLGTDADRQSGPGKAMDAQSDAAAIETRD